MADVGARRPTETRVRLRLERQQREHVIDVAAHSRARPGRHAHTLGDT